MRSRTCRRYPSGSRPLRQLAACRRAPTPLAVGRCVSSREVAFRCGLVHCVRQTSAWIGSAAHLHHAILGHLAICATTNRHPLTLLYRSWTRIYAACLCRARNSAARNRPQRRQRQRRFAWSTLRLSGVRKWPLPQIPGMAMDSTAAGLFAFAEEIPRARSPGSPPDARSRHRVADQISVGQHTA
jgi:hypothetical protein